MRIHSRCLGKAPVGVPFEDRRKQQGKSLGLRKLLSVSVGQSMAGVAGVQ